MLILNILINCLLVNLACSSTLTKPPQSAIIIGFEKSYEQSLLAYTLSDQNIDSTLIVLSSDDYFYDNLEGIEIIRVNASANDYSANERALAACENFLGSANILKRAREIQPTFVIFPALRHDACLLPWTNLVNSIPVIVTYGTDEDFYALQQTQLALPIYTDGFWSRFFSGRNPTTRIARHGSDYVVPALKLVGRYMPEVNLNFEELYDRVELILSTKDTILRTDFALVNQQPIAIGCHHCRGAHPLPAKLQKELVEYRLGTIVSTLDKSFVSMIEEIARKLPQGRQGQALAWINHGVKLDDATRPENLFLHGEVNRQDLIGYARTRVLLSHCEDVDLLEAAFHGTPVVCFPRTHDEGKNAERAHDFGFGVPTNRQAGIETIATIIDNVQKNTSYRECARGVSLLIRDRPLPASDRLVHWLGYVARNAERTTKMPVVRSSAIRTFAGDSDIVSGFVSGMMAGTVVTSIVAAVFWFRTSGSLVYNRKDK